LAAQERSEALQAERKAIGERKMLLKQADKRMKQEQKQKEKEEKQRAALEAKHLQEKEKQKKKEGAAAEKEERSKNIKLEDLDPDAVSNALEKARHRADIVGTNEIQDPKLQQQLKALHNK